MAEKESKKVQPKARDPEDRELQCVALAVDLAEQQLRAGTASSQVITHYLKLGSSRAQLERDKLKEEVAQLKAKTEALQAAKASEELYAKAIKAMSHYAGLDSDEDDRR